MTTTDECLTLTTSKVPSVICLCRTNCCAGAHEAHVTRLSSGRARLKRDHIGIVLPREHHARVGLFDREPPVEGNPAAQLQHLLRCFEDVNITESRANCFMA